MRILLVMLDVFPNNLISFDGSVQSPVESTSLLSPSVLQRAYNFCCDRHNWNAQYCSHSDAFSQLLNKDALSLDFTQFFHSSDSRIVRFSPVRTIQKSPGDDHSTWTFQNILVHEILVCTCTRKYRVLAYNMLIVHTCTCIYTWVISLLENNKGETFLQRSRLMPRR